MSRHITSQIAGTPLPEIPTPPTPPDWPVCIQHTSNGGVLLDALDMRIKPVTGLGTQVSGQKIGEGAFVFYMEDKVYPPMKLEVEWGQVTTHYFDGFTTKADFASAHATAHKRVFQGLIGFGEEGSPFTTFWLSPGTPGYSAAGDMFYLAYSWLGRIEMHVTAKWTPSNDDYDMVEYVSWDCTPDTFVHIDVATIEYHYHKITFYRDKEGVMHLVEKT